MEIDKFIVLSMEFEFGIWGLCFWVYLLNVKI